MSRTRLLDLFSGIGGFSLAFERAGFTTAAHSEVEAFPNRVLAHHWPETPNLGDVTRWPEWGWPEMEDVDVVSFGSPCQDLSVAGKRAGLSGERSGLFHDAVGAVRRSGARFALWENVPGAMYCNGGRDFGAVLDALADAGALDVAWRVLDAQYFGVPQRRRRIFLVADFRGERAAEILFEPEGVRGHPQKGREEGQEVADGLTVGANQYSGFNGESVEVCANERAVGALCANMGQGNQYAASGQHAVVPQLSAALTGGTRWDAETETFVPMGFDWQSGSDVRHNVTSDGEPSLQSSQTPAVTYPIGIGVGGSETGFALRANPSSGDRGDGGMNVNMAIDRVAAFSAGQSENAGSLGYEEERSPTLRGAASGTNMTPTVHEGMAVRRLTPLECERLQGYPDSFTDIPGASDSARYRALGNSVAVPVVEWIAHRMARVLEEV